MSLRYRPFHCDIVDIRPRTSSLPLAPSSFNYARCRRRRRRHRIVYSSSYYVLCVMMMSLWWSQELVMVVWFMIEFSARVWSAGCRSRYQEWRGRLQFARRPLCIVGLSQSDLTVGFVAFELKRVTRTRLYGSQQFHRFPEECPQSPLDAVVKSRQKQIKLIFPIIRANHVCPSTKL